MTKTELVDYIETYIRNSSVESFTNYRLQTALLELANDAASSSFGDAANTTALQALSGASYTYVIVTGSGIYEYSTTGTPNGTTIFAATGGGTWNLIFAGGSGGSSVWGGITGTLSDQTDLQSALNAKQATLVSNTNIKTVNSTSLLGSGNVAVQDTLVSGTNIKTINGVSVLGNGDLIVGPSSFTELTGNTWDGTNKYITLTANKSISLDSTRSAGMLYIVDNDNYTLTINGEIVFISGTGPSIVGFIKVGSDYPISVEMNPVIVPEPDTTPPTVISATAINANTIRVVFDKSMGTVTIAGHSFKQNGSTITPDSVSGNEELWDFVVSETLLISDTILRSYDSGTGATTDVFGNELVSYTDQAVTNSIFNYANVKAYNVNADAAYINFGNAGNAFDFSTGLGLLDQAFSGGMWVKWTGSNYLAFGRDTGSVVPWVLQVSNSGQILFAVTSSSGNLVYKITTGILTANVWSFISFSYDATKTAAGIFLYKDGISVGTEQTVGTYTGMATGGNAFLGGYTGISGRGTVDGLFVCQGVLTGAEMTEIYNAGVPLNIRESSVESDLISYWLFEDDLLDSSSSGSHDGTATTPNYVTF